MKSEELAYAALSIAKAIDNSQREIAEENTINPIDVAICNAQFIVVAVSPDSGDASMVFDQANASKLTIEAAEAINVALEKLLGQVHSPVTRGENDAN